MTDHGVDVRSEGFAAVAKGHRSTSDQVDTRFDAALAESLVELCEEFAHTGRIEFERGRTPTHAVTRSLAAI